MIDDTQGPGSQPPADGQETSLGGASEWSTVAPSSFTPPVAAVPDPVPPPPASTLEPLPQAVPYGSGVPAGPPVPPQPASGPAPTGQSYQQVYGTGPAAPNPYATMPGGVPPVQGPPPPPPAGQGLSSTAAAAISYLTFIPAVIFLVMAPYNRDRFVRFHAWQCIALTIVAVAISVIFSVLGFMGLHFVWWILMMIHALIRIVLFIFWLIAIIKASQGQWYKIPIVGDLALGFAGKEA